MTIDDNENKAVAAVAAPAIPQKRKYKRREAIFEKRFSFTDENMARAVCDGQVNMIGDLTVRFLVYAFT